ncbi:peptidoglycan recognition protein family protein [Pontibacter chinhatensis]|uniref:N-acetylmuramoyl-L-alanine amidase n=1 Tax=Pontibacter chinhatensis TaxID=1436961 RepID=A0A1I2NGD5_9BACT|nr:peptidoglycan recognition family protein [Pontibacter chinhatensis]SFG02954.1 N-acetylmuramoyl-L-alanine amidase [Pontibacter chinhatensis]
MKYLLLIPFILVLLLGCQRPASQQVVPGDIAFLSREAWGANAPVLPMRSHTLNRLTIHHTATKQLPDRTLTDKMRALQKFSQEESLLWDGRTKPQWADIPYHLYIDCHGQVAEGRDLGYAGDSNTAYDPAGHLLVVVEGNFEEEPITPEQMKTLNRLVPALAQRYNIPADSLGGHMDFAQTQCPGKGLYAMLPHFRELVAQNR